MVQHRKTRHTIFKKEKRDIDNYKRQKAKTCKWDILENRLNKRNPKKKTALCKFNFQRLKNMVRRVTIACEKVHICNPPVNYIAFRVHKVFYSTSAEIYSENWSRLIFVFQFVNYISTVVHIP